MLEDTGAEDGWLESTRVGKKELSSRGPKWVGMEEGLV